MNTTDHEAKVQNGFWPKLTKNLAHIPFAAEALAAWYCAFDPATPLRVKATLLGALAYFIVPFDVIPDVLLGIGFTDDMAVLITAITLVRNHITKDHRDRATEALAKLRRAEPVDG